MYKKLIMIYLVFSIVCLNIRTISANTSERGSIEKSITDTYCQHRNCEEDIKLKVKLKKEKIYGLNLGKFGNVYIFNVNNEFEGFIITKDDKELDILDRILEINILSQSPYTDKNGQNIYITFGEYAELVNGMLIDSAGKYEIDYETAMSNLGEITFPSSGYDVGDTYTEEIEYYAAYNDYNYTSLGFPLLSTSINNSIDNNCAPTAATELLMFFDKELSNIIPSFYPIGYTSGINRFKDNTYLSLSANSADKALIKFIHDELANDYLYTNDWYIGFQGLNYDMEGTSPVKFYDGLDLYLDERGYILSNTAIKNTIDHTIPSDLSDVDYEAIKDSIDEGNPVVMQLGVANLFEALVGNVTPQYDIIRYPNSQIDYDFENGNIINDTTVTYTYTVKGEPHTVVGYGYYESTYYYKNFFLVTKTEVEEFIVLENGWGGYSYINTDEYDISIVYSVDVQSKQVPDANITNVQVNQTTVSFNTSIIDPGNFIDYSSSYIEIRRNGTLIDTTSLPSNGSTVYFSGLSMGSEYIINVKLKYKMGVEAPLLSITSDSDSIFINGIEF